MCADHGVSPAAAGVPGLMREHSALHFASSARGPAAERAQLGCAVASRLRRQARSRCFDFGGLSDFVSSSRLGHLFHSSSLVHARVCHMNSSFDTHHARVNSWGTLHAARINSGGHANSSGRNKGKEYEYSGSGRVSCCREACFSAAGARNVACRDVGRTQWEPQPVHFPGGGNHAGVFPLLSFLPCHLGRAEKCGME